MSIISLNNFNNQVDKCWEEAKNKSIAVKAGNEDEVQKSDAKWVTKHKNIRLDMPGNRLLGKSSPEKDLSRQVFKDMLLVFDFPALLRKFNEQIYVLFFIF